MYPTGSSPVFSKLILYWSSSLLRTTRRGVSAVPGDETVRFDISCCVFLWYVGGGLHQIRYWVSTGPGDFSFLPDACLEACFYVLVYRGMPMDKPADSRVLHGVREFTVTDVPLKPSMLATTKSNNYMLNCLTAMDSRDKGTPSMV